MRSVAEELNANDQVSAEKVVGLSFDESSGEVGASRVLRTIEYIRIDSQGKGISNQPGYIFFSVEEDCEFGAD